MYMRAQPNKLKVTEQLEIRIRIEHWQNIVQMAKKHRITFTWVTRLCLFRLLDKWKNLDKEILLANLEEKEAMQKSKEKCERLHRHILCLYGDEIRVRFLAAKLGLTITQLVRIAIILFIASLVDPIERAELVKQGVKVVASVMEFHDNYTKVFFVEGDYWPFRPCFQGT